MSLIYVTEDDGNIRELLRCTLQSFSYEVRCFESAEELWEACAGTLPQLFLLDIMLPGEDGIETLRRLKTGKATAAIPVIMLTAKSAEPDKVTGLDCGADDYITKPFGILELTARVRAVLRRSQSAKLESRGELRYRDIVVDRDKRAVYNTTGPVELTLKEYGLICLLIENASRVMTRDELLGAVWGYDYMGESRTLDMHIKTLRQKLGDDAEHPRYIKTVRGIGYALI